MKCLVVVAACGLLAIPASAGAYQVKSMTSNRVTPIANTVVSTGKDGKICKLVLRTGSRLGDRKICKTKEEWDVISQDARKSTEKKQIFSYRETQ